MAPEIYKSKIDKYLYYDAIKTGIVAFGVVLFATI